MAARAHSRIIMTWHECMTSEVECRIDITSGAMMEVTGPVCQLGVQAERTLTWGAGIAQLVERPTESQAQCRCGFESLVWQGVFLPESASGADSFSLSVCTAHVCNHMPQHLCAWWISQALAAISLTEHMKTLHTLVGMDSAAFAAAVTYPGKVRQPKLPSRDNELKNKKTKKRCGISLWQAVPSDSPVCLADFWGNSHCMQSAWFCLLAWLETDRVSSPLEQEEERKQSQAYIEVWTYCCCCVCVCMRLCLLFSLMWS